MYARFAAIRITFTKMKPVVIASELIANSKQLTEVLLITSVFVFLFWYIKYLWSRRRLYLCSRNMEGPFHLPIIGSSFYFMKNPLGKQLLLL